MFKENLMEQALDILPEIVFIGHVDPMKLYKYYYASDIFVLPSIIDSQGNTEGLGVVLL